MEGKWTCSNLCTLEVCIYSGRFCIGLLCIGKSTVYLWWDLAQFCVPLTVAVLWIVRLLQKAGGSAYW